MSLRKPVNPFYPLLVAVGAAFCVSACAFGVMAWRALHPPVSGNASAEPPHEMLNWLKSHGENLLLWQLAALAALTFAALGTDNYWSRRAAARAKVGRSQTSSDHELPETRK